ncbi:MAG: histidine kinase N-terminal 7TM domain-containing protein [Chloroflexota bacterium]
MSISTQVVYIALVGLSAITMTGLALIGWRRRALPAGQAFFAFAITGATWSTLYTLELAASNPDRILTLSKLSYFGIVSIAPAWFVFAVTLTGSVQRITRRRLLYLAIIPAFVLVMVLTNDLHHLHWRATGITTETGFPMLVVYYGPVFWLNVIFAYVLLVGATYLLLRISIQAMARNRREAAWIVVAALVPWLANALYLTRVLPIGTLDITPIGLSVAGVLVAWPLVRYHALDNLPVLRNQVFGVMRDGLIVTDASDRLVEINAAARDLLNLPAQPLLGRPLPDLLAGHAAVLSFYTRTHDEMDVVTGEATLPAERTVEMTAIPVRDDFDRLLGRMLLLADITERKQSEMREARRIAELTALYDQVSSLEQLKTDMIRIASHDLRSPLGTLRGYLTLLDMDREQLPTDHHEWVDMMALLINRMERIIDDILSLERMQEAAVFEPVDLGVLVRTVVTDEQLEARQRQHALTVDTPSQVISISADAVQLREALTNLISNAIKYTPAGGRIDVRLWQAGGMVKLEVTDTGYGIPEDQHTRLFKPFSRTYSEATATIQGTGLGLHLVKNIIDRHGGTIIFRSVYGSGSTFGFSLPLVAQSAAVRD